MGCFDSIYVPCPRCETVADFQTKAGECAMRTYTLDTAPLVLLLDVQADVEICQKCKTPFHIELCVTYAARPVHGLKPAPEENE